MRAFVLWAVLGLIAIGAAACTGGGSTTVPIAAPAATTASNVVLLPTAPPAGQTASIALPGQLGLVPTLTLGLGFAAGTNLAVSTTNYGQPRSASIASCPVVLAVTMYFNVAVPLSAFQAFAVQYASLASFLGTGPFSVSFYDLNEVQTAGSPLPPAATNGCATAPNNLLVIASSTANGAGGNVTFSNFTGNAGVATSIATKFNLGSGGGGTIPANEVVGFYVAVVTASPLPSPTKT